MQRYLIYPIFARFIDTFPIDLSSPRDGEGAGILEKGLGFLRRVRLRLKLFTCLKIGKPSLLPVCIEEMRRLFG